MLTMQMTWGHTARLRPGVINHAARECFTNGQCHSLALALNTLTDWPIYAVRPHYGRYDHFVVKSPKGFLDIDGLNYESRMYEGDTLHKISMEHFYDIIRELGYLPIQVDAAISFASRLLRKFKFIQRRVL